MLFLFTVASFARAALLDGAQNSGVVQDERGGVIPGARVTAIHQATQLPTRRVTNETGYYVFSNLLPRSLRHSGAVAGLQ